MLTAELMLPSAADISTRTWCNFLTHLCNCFIFDKISCSPMRLCKLVTLSDFVFSFSSMHTSYHINIFFKYKIGTILTQRTKIYIFGIFSKNLKKHFWFLFSINRMINLKNGLNILNILTSASTLISSSPLNFKKSFSVNNRYSSRSILPDALAVLTSRRLRLFDNRVASSNVTTVIFLPPNWCKVIIGDAYLFPAFELDFSTVKLLENCRTLCIHLYRTRPTTKPLKNISL